MAIPELASKLRESGIGANIVSENKIFEMVERALFAEHINRMGYKLVIEKMDGDFKNEELLIESYEIYDKMYKEIISKQRF